ncbi:unnamed protein product [Symbiodinium microadriaticum]|nr:unnamed protein product [Symbiodinium microadriaticum]
MDDIPPHLRLGDEQEEENFVASVYGKFPDCESQPGEPLSECAEHACPQPSAASNVSADSRVYHGEPAAQSSSDMKASLGALASLVALHFHGRDTAFAIEPPPKASAPKVSASKAKTKKPSPVERDLDWPRAERADPKDPRTLGPPCNGLHQEALPGRGSPSGANGHAMWRACRVCGLRILYVPRIGAHGLSRKAGPLSADTAQAVKELGSFSATEPAVVIEGDLDGYPENPKPDLEYQDLRTKLNDDPKPNLGPPAKSAAAMPKAAVPSNSAVDLTDEQLPTHPGRKSRREAPAAEELEFQNREMQNRLSGEDLAPDAEACWMAHDDKMQIEAQAKDACHRAVFTFRMLEKILMSTFKCAKGKSRSTVHQTEGKICNHLYGYYVFGGFSGITNRTQEFPEVTTISETDGFDQESHVYNLVIELGAKPEGTFENVMQKHQVPAYNLNAQGKCSLKSQAGIQKTSSLLERLGCGGMFNKDHDLSHAPPRDLMILFCLPVKLEAILGENLATSQQLSEGKHGGILEDDSAFTVDASEILQDLDLKELEALTHIAMQLHRKMGHPGNRLLVRNLKARGADQKLLAVASQLKCEECYEGQFKNLQPVVNLEKEDTIWSTVQIDVFTMKIAKAVFHFILYVDEASGYDVVDEVMRHPADSNENISTPPIPQILAHEMDSVLRDPHRDQIGFGGGVPRTPVAGLVRDQGRVRLEHAPAEFHQSIGDVERQIGFLRHKIEVFLRHEPQDPSIEVAIGTMNTSGDLIYYRRLKEPADQAANSIVDKSRMRIGRFYGPGRVLASETKVEPDGRKASHMIWIISQGRVKKPHSSQLRHATEQERLISKAFEQQAMPWIFSALIRLLDKGEYDDETIPPPTERQAPMNEDPEPRVPDTHPPPQDVESEPELIPVPQPTTSRSRSPVPPAQEDYEEPPVPAQSLVVEDLLRDVNYLPSFASHQWTARPRKGNRRMRRGLQQTPLLDKQEAEQSVFSVVIDAPGSEAGWKRIVKDPRKFVSKSIQKGVEVNWQKLSPEHQKAMAEAKVYFQWISTQACEAVRHVVPDSQLLRMRWVLTFKSAGSDAATAGKMKAKDKDRKVVVGIVTSHVDDFLLGGVEDEDTWTSFVEAFHASYKWSPWDLKQIPVPREDRPMSDSEMSQGDIINLSKSYESTRKTAGYLVIALSQHIQEQDTTLLWCDSDHQLADGMTKSQKQDCIKKLLVSGIWRLRFDDAFLSAKKRRNMLATSEEQLEREQRVFRPESLALHEGVTVPEPFQLSEAKDTSKEFRRPPLDEDCTFTPQTNETHNREMIKQIMGVVRVH